MNKKCQIVKEVIKVRHSYFKQYRIETMEKRSGCRSCRTWEEETYWKHFSSLHFFLSLPTDFHHHLVLPVKFTDNLAANLPEKVSLIGPSATRWDVELIKKNDNIAFGGDGWKEFVRAYDLQENNLLVFKYKRSSSFEALIFDPKSFCEKEAGYFVKQCGHTNKAEPENKKRTISEAFSVEGGEDEDNNDRNDSNDKETEQRENPPRTSRKHIPASTPQSKDKSTRSIEPCESLSKSKTQSESEPEGNRRVHDVVEDEPHENGAAKELSYCSESEHNTPESGGSVLETTYPCRFTHERDRSMERLKSSRRSALKSVNMYYAERYAAEYKLNRRSATEIEKINVMLRAKAFDGSTKNSFICTMKPSFVYKRFYMNIPVSWARGYYFTELGGLKGNSEMVLRIGEKTWTTSFSCNMNLRGKPAIKGSGWKKFVLDNSLEELDVCVFTPNSQKHNPATATVLDVEIFRVITDNVPPSTAVGVGSKSA